MNQNENTKKEKTKVELIDITYEGKIYDPLIFKFAFAGFLIGGVLIGLLFYLFSTGAIPLKGFGQLTAAGSAPITFFGFGLGSALGGLIGALIGLFQLHPNKKKLHHN